MLDDEKNAAINDDPVAEAGVAAVNLLSMALPPPPPCPRKPNTPLGLHEMIIKRPASHAQHNTYNVSSILHHVHIDI